MNLREALMAVLARDHRYSIQAYAFVFEALEYAKAEKRKAIPARKGRARPARAAEADGGPLHVTGQELSLAARDLALRLYGMMAPTVLSQWGLRSTSDLGEIVYNMIASGDLEKTESDSRADFDNVFDFEAAFCRDYAMVLDDPI
jgi:uncharacterized repeat protein (TIGR04138 family)